MRNLLLTVHQHGGDDVTCKPRIGFVYQGGNIPIRLNAAAIMREGVLFDKKEEEELKRLIHVLYLNKRLTD
jgi:hypothetical protein